MAEMLSSMLHFLMCHQNSSAYELPMLNHIFLNSKSASLSDIKANTVSEGITY